MTVFWIVAAMFLLGALLFLLPGLLAPKAGSSSILGVNTAVHRDQLREAESDLAAGLITPERLDQARHEIERRVLEDSTGTEAVAAQPARRTAWALAVLIPLASVLTYLELGMPEAAAPRVAATKPQGDRHSSTPEQIQQMVTALAERLKAQPDDVNGWLTLARSYTSLGRYRDAATAFRRAKDLGPPNASLLADLADVTGMAEGKRLTGEPARLIQQALDVDPRHAKALALAGSVAFEAKDYSAAKAYWERLLAVLPPEAPIVRSVQGSIAQAAQLGAGAVPATTQAATAPASTAASSAVSGKVSLSPELASQVGAGDTLFVFARAALGPRMPLAIQRQPAVAGPVSFKLDDSMAMQPNLRLSGFAQIVIGARISKSGNATPQPGDLVGQSAAVAPGTGGLHIVIDRVQP